MGQAASGMPNAFITLTANPRLGDSPDDRLKKLSHAWAVIVKRLRRQYPKRAIEYMAVVEATKRGEPHLHILFVGPFVPQRKLSTWMLELTGSPIVDIRKIRSQREVVRYVAKYITKKPAQFGTSKRYWQSRDYQLPDAEREALDEASDGAWFPVFQTLEELAYRLERNGYEVTYDDGQRWEGIPPPYEGEYAST